MGRRKKEPSGKMYGKRPRTAPMDVSALSEASQRSYGAVGPYRDEWYTCRGCDDEVLFSALDQKNEYEVKKVHLSVRRVRCAGCQAEWKRLRREVHEYPQRLRASELGLKDLRAMIETLDRLQVLGGVRLDSALRQRIQNRLEEISSAPQEP